MDADRQAREQEEQSIWVGEREYRFPKGMSDKEISKALENETRGQDIIDTAVGHGKAAGSGVVSGAVDATLGAPRGIADTRNMLQQGMSPGFQKANELLSWGLNPGWTALHKGMEKLPSTEDIVPEALKYKPQTQAEKYTQEVARTGTGFAVGGPKGLVGRSTFGGILGGGSQLVQDLLEGQNPESPKAKAIAQAGGMFAYILASLRKPGHVKMSQNVAGDVGPEGLTKADEVANRASTDLDTKVVLPQGAESPAMTNLMTMIMENPAGEALRRTVERQLAKGKAKIGEIREGLTTRKDVTSQPEANRVLEAGKTAIERPTKIAQAGTKDLYEAAGNQRLDPSILTNTAKDIRAAKRASNQPMTGDAAKAMDRARRKVLGASETMIDPVTGDPVAGPVSPMALKILADEAAKRGVPAVGMKPADVNAMRANLDVSNLIKDRLHNASAPLRQADDIYGNIMQNAQGPMNRGPLPKMFPESMQKSGVGDWDVYTSALNKAGAGDVPFIAANLNRADPTKQAFGQVVANWWGKAADKAAKPIEGRPNQGMLGNWVTEIAGAQGTEQRLKALEIIRQLHGDQAVSGFDAVLDALHVVSRDRAVWGESAAAMSARGGHNIISQSLRSIGFQPGVTIGRSVENMIQARAVRKLQRILLEPNAAQRLIEIANHSSPAEAGLAFVHSILAANDDNE